LEKEDERKKHMKTITNITYPVFAFACFALSPTLRAVDPPPDGGYPNSNTAEGDDALSGLIEDSTAAAELLTLLEQGMAKLSPLFLA
jgi:hypothetical protein